LHFVLDVLFVIYRDKTFLYYYYYLSYAQSKVLKDSLRGPAF